MAEETQKQVVAAAAAEEVAAPEAEKSSVPVEKEVPAPEPEPESADEKAAAPAAEEEEVPAEAEKPAPIDEKKIEQSISFKEETNVASELPDAQSKALDELKKLVQEALNKHEFTAPPPPPSPPKEEEKKEEETPAPPIDKIEEEVVEELKKEEAGTEAEAPPPPPPAQEPPKEAAPPAVEPVVVVEKVAAVVDDDGAKTVEAIAETIVPVSAPIAEESTAAPVKEEATAEEEKAPEEEQAPPPPPEEVFLWGIPLLGDERSDAMLLKFLRARDFKVKEAFAMLKNTVKWRKEFGVEELLEEDLGSDYEKVVFAHGVDKEGRPVVYNVFGEFQDKDLYQNTFSDSEKQKNFLRWLVQFLEKTVRKLDFSPTGISSLVLVNDLKNSPGYGKRELYKVTNKFLQLLQDNYPEFVAKQICINVSWWYLAYTWVYLSVFTPRSKSKFVFAGPSKTAETIFKYIAPEYVPVQFGGHSRAGESEFTSSDPVTEVNIKPNSKHTVEFSFTETCVLVWELRVVGWDVNYEAQFVPAEGYTVLVSKPRKVTVADEPIIYDSYKVVEPGKLILTIDSQVSKKKKLLYRSKIKASE